MCLTKSCNEKVKSPLQKVIWKAEISGPLMTYKSFQHYRNDSSDPAEIVYNFPLPYGKSAISKFRVIINGISREAKVYSKEKSKECYGEGIESADTPILIETTEKDFCTVSLGNIKPGETASVELEYFQLLECCDGRIRLRIPTVIDDRFASDWQADPQNEHEITTNIAADYRCEGFIRVQGEHAYALISSPTHHMTTRRIRAGLEFQISSSLGHDVVLEIRASAASRVYLAKDENGYAALANFKMTGFRQSSHLDLTVLADCSDSMSGERMELQKDCLKELSRTLMVGDKVALIAFGDKPQLRCLPKSIYFENVGTDFESAVDGLDADLGVKDLYTALSSAVSLLPGQNERSAILLLTDGEFWVDYECIADIAMDGQRRMFILGIGMEPYHNALKEIAEETGGAYEAVYNEHDIVSAVKRICARMRLADIADAKVQWNVPVQWQSETPTTLFAADFASSFAFLRDKPETVELSFKKDGDSYVEEARVLGGDIGYKLCQLAAYQRMLASKDKAEATRIGLKYNIAGPETNFFLLAERNKAEKTDGVPALVLVPQMPVSDRTCCPMRFSLSAQKRSTSSVRNSFDTGDQNFCRMESVSESGRDIDEASKCHYLCKPLEADTRLELAQIIVDFVDTHEEVRKLIYLVGDIYTLSILEISKTVERLRYAEPELWKAAVIGYCSFISFSGKGNGEYINQPMFVLHVIAALNVVQRDYPHWTKIFDTWIEGFRVKDAQEFKERLGL